MAVNMGARVYLMKTESDPLTGQDSEVVVNI